MAYSGFYGQTIRTSTLAVGDTASAPYLGLTPNASGASDVQAINISNSADPSHEQWAVVVNQAGSGTGFDLKFDRYNDSGANQGSALVLSRATGAATFQAGVAAGGSILSSSTSAGVGYSGAGTSVTQETNKTTGVTANNITGNITTSNANLLTGATASFTVNCSSCGANDLVLVQHASGGTAGSYLVSANAVASGSFAVSIQNVTGGTLGEALVIRYAIIKCSA